MSAHRDRLHREANKASKEAVHAANDRGISHKVKAMYERAAAKAHTKLAREYEKVGASANANYHHDKAAAHERNQKAHEKAHAAADAAFRKHKS